MEAVRQGGGNMVAEGELEDEDGRQTRGWRETRDGRGKEAGLRRKRKGGTDRVKEAYWGRQLCKMLGSAAKT